MFLIDPLHILRIGGSRFLKSRPSLRNSQTVLHISVRFLWHFAKSVSHRAKLSYLAPWNRAFKFYSRNIVEKPDCQY